MLNRAHLKISLATITLGFTQLAFAGSYLSASANDKTQLKHYEAKISAIPDNQPADERLKNTNWELVGLTDPLDFSPMLAKPVLHIAPDGKSFKANTGCNKIAGTVKSQVGRVAFGEVTQLTQKSCASEATANIAHRFVNAFSNSRFFATPDQTLILSNEFGRVLATFKNVDIAPEKVERIVPVAIMAKTDTTVAPAVIAPVVVQTPVKKAMPVETVQLESKPEPMVETLSEPLSTILPPTEADTRPSISKKAVKRVKRS